MEKIVLHKSTNQGEYKVIEKHLFETVYYEIKRKFMFLWFIPMWFTLNDGDMEVPFTYKWRNLDDVNEFFKTGKIRFPGTVI